jgi:DNA-binding transcriptional LysR family regulator
MNVTLKQIHAFVAVAQAARFTRAAERLHVTQSALSVLIRELERSLGVRLFDRTTRTVRLTEAGREFYPAAEKILADLEHAITNSRDLVARKRGRVVVAATPLIAAALLPPLIARFRSRFPEISVIARDTSAINIESMVRDGEVDYGIGWFERPERELLAEPFFIDTLMVACPREHPLAHKRRVAWRDLAEEPLITVVPVSPVGQLIQRQLADLGITAKPAFEVAFISTALGMVNARLGLAIVPAYGHKTMHMRDVAFRKLTSPVTRRQISTLTRRDRSPTPAAESFKDCLVAFAHELVHRGV